MKTTNERCNDIENKISAERKKRSKRSKILLSVTACAAALILTLGLVLFIPYPTYSIEAYQNSEYYPLIQTLDKFRPVRKYRNNFERLQLSFQSMFKGYGNATGDALDPGAAPSEFYEEVTDNQTAGVIEGDLFKRSNTTAYYLSVGSNAYSLDVYPLNGVNTARSAQIVIEPEKNTLFSAYADRRELFLNADATLATILTPCYNTEKRAVYTAMISVDLIAQKEIGRMYFSGDYVSSRLVDGQFLLATNFAVRGYDFDDQSQYLPQYGNSFSNLNSIPMSEIVLPDTATAARYTVLYSVGEDGLGLTDSLALLSYSDEIYVSEENVYATLACSYAQLSEEAQKNFSHEPIRVTTVTQVGYTNGLTVKNSCVVNGTVNDRYSLDEYEGVFRIVTSASGILQNGEIYDYYTSANLYCLNAETFEEIARVERFAPDGERVMSARFKGDKAYVCTAIEYLPDLFNDPVFAFDLSDYGNITFTDTGTIPGYSLFLSAFKDGTLLGIGYGDGGLTNLKIELYEETESTVESVAAFECTATFANEYKAYFIDRVNGLIGLGLVRDGKSEYCLLQFDGYRIVEILTLEIGNDDAPAQQRAFVLDGVLYVFCPTTGIHTATF